MAEYRPLCFLFFLAALYNPMASSSRSLQSSTTKISTLDVTSSLQQALNSLASKPIKPSTLQEQQLTSHSLTLPLHSRTSLLHRHHPHHTDYAFLTRSRLARDSLRVHSIYSKLNLAVTNNATTDKTVHVPPLDPKNQSSLPNNTTKPEDQKSSSIVEGPLVSGVSQGSGEYFSRVGIGQPTSRLYVVIDTGSDVSWIQCSPCTDCYTQSDPIFIPSASTSYSPLLCSSPQCTSLDVHECRPQTGDNSSTRCVYEVSYGDGSYTIGDFATETVSLGPASVNNVAIGCGHDNQGLFVGAAGILGLGGGPLSFPAQINASSFSYCLVDRDSDSSSTLDFDLGGGDGLTFTTPTSSGITAKLLRNRQVDTFYFVEMTGLSVGGEILGISTSAFQMDESGSGGVIIDSGTAVTRLAAEAYDALKQAFVRGTTHLPMTDGGEEVAGLFDTCYDLTGLSSVDVPAVALRFGGGGELSLPAKNYLIPVNGEGTFCLAFAPTSSSPSIIGNVQQQGTRVSFDLANSVVRFDASKC